MGYKVKEKDEAVHIANDTEFGLGSSIYGNNEKDALDLAKKINAGMVYINHLTISVGPELPFGGIKKSGYGRELSQEAIYEFMNHKLIRISNPKALY